MKVRKAKKQRSMAARPVAGVLYTIGVDVQAKAVSVTFFQHRRAATVVLRHGVLDQFAELVNEAVATCRRSQ